MSRDCDRLMGFFVFLFLLLVLLFPGASWAATTIIPDVPGYSGGVNPGYTPSAATASRYASQAASYSAPTKSYPVTGKITLASKALAVPGSASLTSNAGSLVKGAMQLHPGKLVGTLAAGWLMSQGLEYLNDQWFKDSGQGTLEGVHAPIYSMADGAMCINTHSGQLPAQVTSCFLIMGGGGSDSGVSGCPVIAETPGDGNPYNDHMTYLVPRNPFPNGCSLVDPIKTPATPADFDSLPDPTDDPGVAGELAKGPGYMPEGAPVNPPQYQTGNHPLGTPYKAPDGSTVQPMASVTNNSTINNHSVTVTTYNITTHNSSGVPLDNPVPVPTDEKQSFCEENPKSVGCIELGTPEAGDVLPRTEIPITFEPIDVGGNATCPAPNVMSVGGYSIPIEYDSICHYATSLNPVVIALSYLTALMIVFGVFSRSAE
jgi:hypothetical protein